METYLPHSGATVSGNPEVVATAIRIDRQLADEQRAWVASLRQRGIKAAHPDDGWVDREKNTIHLCYPQFNDGLGIGDLLALGSPGRPTRLVRVTGGSENRFALPIHPKPWYWHFEEVR